MPREKFNIDGQIQQMNSKVGRDWRITDTALRAFLERLESKGE